MNNIEIDYEKPCIYQFKHKESGKIYIGSARNGLKARTYVHLSIKRGCPKFQAALEKYGIDAFERSILEYCDPEILIEREQYYLDTLQPFNEAGYNICKIAGSIIGYKHSEEAKQKIGLVHKGKIVSDETKQKQRSFRLGKLSPMLNRHHSKETKQKMSLAKEGKSTWNKGISCSEETKQKISQSLIGRKQSEETIQKIRSTKLRNKLNMESQTN